MDYKKAGCSGSRTPVKWFRTTHHTVRLNNRVIISSFCISNFAKVLPMSFNLILLKIKFCFNYFIKCLYLSFLYFYSFLLLKVKIKSNNVCMRPWIPPTTSTNTIKTKKTCNKRFITFSRARSVSISGILLIASR